MEGERKEREQTKSVLRPSLFALKGGREKRERERGENFILIKTGKNSALLYGNFSTGKWDLWDFRIMGFGNYGICDLGFWYYGRRREKRGETEREG